MGGKLAAAGDVSSDAVEFVGRGSAKETHRRDGDDTDERNEEHVLDECGAFFFCDKTMCERLDHLKTSEWEAAARLRRKNYVQPTSHINHTRDSAEIHALPEKILKNPNICLRNV